MNIQIITSSYPAYPEDPSGTAGLFVRAFALELQKQGHQVVVQPVARKHEYTPDDGLIIDPLPWQGGDRELASLNFYSPFNWFNVLVFFLRARQKVLQANKQYKIDRTLCMWAVPSGFLGYLMSRSLNKPYDVWALGSDIWRIRKIPLMGRFLLRKIIGRADRVFADGLGLCREVQDVSGRQCAFLPSSRVLPPPKGSDNPASDMGCTNLLFVGRYHPNKGPDVLLKAMQGLQPQIREKVRLRMFGIGPLKSSLIRFVEEHRLEDCVVVNDGIHAEELVGELSRSAYLVIPSRIESIPVIFSDALQAGLPVIALPVGDLPLLISESDCGILATDCSPEALARAIEVACDCCQKERYAENAYKLAREFRIDAAAKKWVLGDDV